MRLQVAGIIAVLTMAPMALQAAPLGKEACDALKTERDALVGKGVETDMSKGPEWAKTNLPQERMNEIARMIELDEQLTFRCGRQIIAIPTLKKELPVAPAPDAKKEAAPSTPAKVEIDTPSKPADAASAPAKPAPAAKKKAANKKASDAYVPPPASPTHSPDAVNP